MKPASRTTRRNTTAPPGAMAILCCALLGLAGPVAFAQNTGPTGGAQSGEAAQQVGGAPELDNPVSVVTDAADALPGLDGKLSSTLNILLLLTILSIAPAILVLTTSFTRIVIVLALLRQAIGTQTLPPTQVLIGLAMFMTFFVMAPTLKDIHEEAIQPLSNNEINQVEAWSRARQPLRDFMFGQLERTGNWGDLYMVLNYRGVDTSNPSELKRGDVGTLSLIPAFILSELKTAFLMGFRIYLPFLIIDMVVSSLLISMGMLMLPPVLISLPFKLLLFVLVDGWRLVVGNLLDSFAIPIATGAVG